jgi:hypothetical protein
MPAHATSELFCALHRRRPGEPAPVTGQSEWTFDLDRYAAATAPGNRTGLQVVRDGLRIFSDPYGMTPLFLASAGERSAAAPSAFVAAAAAGCTEPDDDALAVFVRLGFFVGNDTPIGGVQQVPPAVDSVWRGDAFGGPESTPAPATSDVSFAEAVDIYDELFARSLAVRCNGALRCVVPLSGGRDSRHILARLERMGCDPLAVTLEHWPGHADERIARDVAAALSIEHRVVPTTPARLLRLQPAKNLATDYLADEHAWAVALLPALVERGGRVFDGLAGGMLSNGAFYAPEFERRLRAGACEQAADHMLGSEKRMSLTPAVLRKRWPRERAIARLAAFLQPFGGRPDPSKEAWFWSRTRREIALAPLRLYRPRRRRAALSRPGNGHVPQIAAVPDVRSAGVSRRRHPSNRFSPGGHRLRQPRAIAPPHHAARTLQPCRAGARRRKLVPGGRGPVLAARVAHHVVRNADPDSLWWLNRACHLQELHRAFLRLGGGLV